MLRTWKCKKKPRMQLIPEVDNPLTTQVCFVIKRKEGMCKYYCVHLGEMRFCTAVNEKYTLRFNK